MRNTAPILWLCGPSGVGKSTVGYEVFRILYSSGTKCAYVDLDQIGFARPAPAADPDNHQLKSRNLALLRASFGGEQVERLVISGIVHSADVIRTYRKAVPAARMSVYRLSVSDDQLRYRILLRGAGGGPPLPGDSLLGRPREWLSSAADDSIAEANEMERMDIGDLTIGTDGRTVAEVAVIVRDQWLSCSPLA